MGNKRKYVISFATSFKAIYLALVEDKATLGYLLGYKFTRPPFSIKINPHIDFQFFKSPAQWE